MMLYYLFYRKLSYKQNKLRYFFYNCMNQYLDLILVFALFNMKPHQKQLDHQHNLLTQSLCLQSSSQSQLQNTQLDSQQVQKTLRTLRKLKRISKNRKLTELKQKNKNINQLFKKMSEFFNVRSKDAQAKKKQKDQLRFARKQALQAAGIRKLQNLQCIINEDKLQSVNNPIQQLNQLLNDSNNQIKCSKCYICKARYTSVHHFYDCMCLVCGDFNYQKRIKSASLSGHVALVTGARIKIGFQIALKLLRDGATVIATTRFFKDAFLRYQKQNDYQNWAQRLFIIQCDFTSSPQVSELIQTIKTKFTKLDILINNAAQTIVRPKQFYMKQLVNSTKDIPSLPTHIKTFQPKLSQSLSLTHRYPSLFLPQKQSNLLELQSDQSSPLIQIQKMQQSNNQINHDIRDQFDQPLDLRQSNTWVENLADVSLIDCYTTQLVNSIVPFHLISQLKPLMKKSSDQPPSYIVNVSSMQGVFYRANKQSTHPHTNMAKAALNMMTRTSAKQFADDNIYMSAVDTGWVTEQNPQSYQLKRLIPLDCVDGAMRVLDPIYTSIQTGVKQYAKFFKDYKESNW